MRVLFVGLAGTRVAWYRCALPALFWPGGLQDWATMTGSPPYLAVRASWVDGSTLQPDMFKYDVVVLEQVRGLKWLEAIKRLQSNGQRVIYETDDYVHGVKDVPDHDFRAAYQPDDLKAIRLCMRACDGMIVSTPLLAELYKDMARKIWVCENGLDLGRYRLTRPPRGEVAGRESVSVIWSGATGHGAAMARWIPTVGQVLRDVPHATFVTVGKDYSSGLQEYKDRTMTVPFSSLETYTSAMMLGDVAIAPAGNLPWHRSKSQLRAMEAMALGIPLVGDPHYRETIETYDGGFVADNQVEARDFLRELVENDQLRAELSSAARVTAHAKFGMQVRVSAWVDAVADALDQPSVR